MLLPVRCSHCGHVSASRVSVSAAGDVMRDQDSDGPSDPADHDCPMCGGVLGTDEESSAIALLADLTKISASAEQQTAFVATLRDSLDKLQAEDVVRARVERESPEYQPVMDQIPKFGVNFLSWASLVLALTTANGRSEIPPPPEPSAGPKPGAEPDAAEVAAGEAAEPGAQPSQRGPGRRAAPTALYTIEDVAIDGESLIVSESPRAQHSGYPLWMASLDSKSSTCKLSGRLIYSRKAQAMDRPRLFVAYYLGSAFHKSWQARLVSETPDCDSWSVRIHLSRETRGGWCYIYTSDKVILGGVEIRRWVRYVVTKT